MKNLFIPKEGSTSIVLVMAPIGSFYEDKRYAGISHFLEHMVFKGNKNRNVKEISAAIDNVGGELNAFTCEEMTCYWAKVSNRYVELAKEVIGDLATIPLIPAKEVEKERQVILQEMKMYEDNPKDAVYDIFNQTLYKKDSCFYVSTIGTKESLYRIKQKELKEFHKKYYKDLTMVVIGDTVEKTDKPYADSGEGEFGLIEKPMINFQHRNNITQSNILLGYQQSSPCKTWLETNYMVKILSALYSDMSGRLFSSVREKHNLVYRIHFICDVNRDNSVSWKVSLGLDAENIPKAENLIVEELTRPITKLELEKMKIKALGTMDMIYDDIHNLAASIAYRLAKKQDYIDCLEDNKLPYLDFSINKVNDFIVSMNFKKHCIAGILP